MTNFDENRRALMKKGIASVGLVATAGIPSIALGNPLIIGSLVGAIATSVFGAISSMLSNRQQTKQAFELDMSRLAQRRIDYLFDKMTLTEQLAMVRDGSYFNALVTGNLDGFSSQLAVVDGQIIIARGGVGGPVHSDMARPIMTVMDEVGVLPVPVTYTPASEVPKLTSAYEFLAAKKGMSIRDYKEQFPAKEVTTMSFATQPRKGGEDFAFLTSLNLNQARSANGRMEAPVNVNPVPMSSIG